MLVSELWTFPGTGSGRREIQVTHKSALCSVHVKTACSDSTEMRVKDILSGSLKFPTPSQMDAEDAAQQHLRRVEERVLNHRTMNEVKCLMNSKQFGVAGFHQKE